MAYVPEDTPHILKQEEPFFVGYLPRALFDHVIRVAIGQEQVRGAVIVVVEKPQSPPTQHASGAADLGRLVGKR